MAKKAARAADHTTVLPLTRRRLDAWACVIRERQESLRALFGAYEKRSYVRDDLMRMVVLRAADGHFETVSFYVRAIGPEASRSLIRKEVGILEHAGLVVLEQRKGSAWRVVKPTGKLVDYYDQMMSTDYERMVRLFQGENSVKP